MTQIHRTTAFECIPEGGASPLKGCMPAFFPGCKPALKVGDFGPSSRQAFFSRHGGTFADAAMEYNLFALLAGQTGGVKRRERAEQSPMNAFCAKFSRFAHINKNDLLVCKKALNVFRGKEVEHDMSFSRVCWQGAY